MCIFNIVNFLAHIYLSFEDPDVEIGNFVADSVKGDGLPHHSPRIKSGIALHRAIDDFTDHHPIVRESKHRLFEKYSHYSAVLVDIFYDHFLAINWNQWHPSDLASYAQEHYAHFKSREKDLPKQVKHMLPYMVEYDWLTNYGTFEGMQRVLNGMSRRASFDSHMDEATNELRRYHSSFENEFNTFFPELVEFAKSKLEELKKLEP